MRRLIACLLPVLALAAAGPVRADATTDANDVSDGVRAKLGSEDLLNSNGFQPLSTDTALTALDGTNPTSAKITCNSSQEFIKVWANPGSLGDIQSIDLAIDANLDSVPDQVSTFEGPYAAVCINGVIQCDAGTMNNCSYQQWQGSPSGVSLKSVTKTELGTCYCINNSCGTNLLVTNNNKVLADVGGGIETAFAKYSPRVAPGKAVQTEAGAMTFYGSLASCGSDALPEQYVTHPGDMVAAGAAEAAKSDSMASIIGASGSPSSLSVKSCTVKRDFTFRDIAKPDIVAMTSVSRGATSDCGPGCVQFTIGDDSGNIYGGGSGGSICRINTEHMTFSVGHPELIDSIALSYQHTEYASQLYLSSAFVFTSLSGWTSPGLPMSRCADFNHASSPNLDIKSFFASAGSVTGEMDTATDKWGFGKLVIEAHVNDGCSLSDEQVEDGCSLIEGDDDCTLMSEKVDGVITIDNYLVQSGAVLSSTRTYSDSMCSVTSDMRPWWTIERTYSCKTKGSASMDVSDVLAAHDASMKTLTADGSFSYSQTNADGSTTQVADAVNLPLAPVAPAACHTMCKTRRQAEGITVTDGGPTNTLNASGLPWVYNYKDCDAAGECPLDSGEEVVSACNCTNNFVQAFSVIQAARFVAEDLKCGM